jgi:hypothetical protein
MNKFMIEVYPVSDLLTAQFPASDSMLLGNLLDRSGAISPDPFERIATYLRPLAKRFYGTVSIVLRDGQGRVERTEQALADTAAALGTTTATMAGTRDAE